MIVSLDTRRRGDTRTPHNLKTAFTERSDPWQLIEKDGENEKKKTNSGILPEELWEQNGVTGFRVRPLLAIITEQSEREQRAHRKNIPWKAAPVFVLPQRLASADHKSSQPEISWPPLRKKKKKKSDLKNL